MEIMLPLNALTKKDAPWQWGHKEQRAFEDMKQQITSEPILAHPQLDQPFELETDASGYAIGAVLLQQKEDNKRHPVGYYSATLNAAERNYDVYDLELLAVVKALRTLSTTTCGISAQDQGMVRPHEPEALERPKENHKASGKGSIGTSRI